MSEEWIAGLITIAVIAVLIAWVPCLNGVSRCLSLLVQESDRQAARLQAIKHIRDKKR